jgi:inosine-uridine nucleoside N-ribohydrolase
MQLADDARFKLLSPPQGQIRAVMDTDTYNEIDDQFAIVQMMLSPDRINVEGIYAAPFHNARSNSPGHGMEQSHAEILRLLERIGVSSDGLVYKGVVDYVGPGKIARDAAAVEHLIERAMDGSAGNPLYVIAIAAISNVASAILKAPEIIDRIVVVWLGGHVLHWPHTKEFNLKQDVGGAQVLFDCGVPVVLVPCMGVASHLHSSVPEIEKYIEPQGDIGAFLSMRFKEYSDNHKGYSKEIWDMAAVAWALNPDWAPSVLTSSPVLSEQMTWSVDQRRHSVRYVTELDRDAIMRDFINKLEVFAELKKRP